MIPTWNPGRYLRDTLASVLGQAPPPGTMQIEVVDDASTRDDPASVVDAIGAGRVAFHRQPHNVGAIGNFNTCVLRARGRFVHILHADDLVRPGFYDALGGALARHPAAGAAFCRCAAIDGEGRETWHSELERPDAGILDDFLPRIAVSSRIQTPTVVVRRTVYETLGGYDPRLFHTADWEMWQLVRAGFRLGAALDLHVEHHIDPRRLLRQSFAAAAVRRGRVLAYQRHHWEHLTVPHLWRKRARTMATLALRRATRRHAVEGMPAWEMTALEHLAFLRQWRIERRRPRHYERFGLRRIR